MSATSRNPHSHHRWGTFSITVLAVVSCLTGLSLWEGGRQSLQLYKTSLPKEDSPFLELRFETIEADLVNLEERLSLRNETGLQNRTMELTFCVEWEKDLDHWWTHHPEWYISHENDTHYCLSRFKNQEKVEFLRDLHRVQFQSDCNNISVKQMWSSGWATDVSNVVDALHHAKETGIPSIMTVGITPWHYTAGKQRHGRVEPFCPTADMNCYFLSITNCTLPPNATIITGKFYPRIGVPGAFDMPPFRWYLEYATRAQTWLRREIYHFSKNVSLVTPCAVVHVRRADVILHNEWSRRYHPIQEYIQGLRRKQVNATNLLLLTDDHNAIGEARQNFPNYNWMFIDRPRFQGSEGGWENQIPSKDPKHEVLVLLTIFRLVKFCSAFVFSTSSLAKYIYSEMLVDGTRDVVSIDLDQGVDFYSLYNASNMQSVNVSRQNRIR